MAISFLDIYPRSGKYDHKIILLKAGILGQWLECHVEHLEYHTGVPLLFLAPLLCIQLPTNIHQVSR